MGVETVTDILAGRQVTSPRYVIHTLLADSRRAVEGGHTWDKCTFKSPNDWEDIELQPGTN